MDWKSFIASIVGSIAWPAVVAFILYLLKGQLAPLVQRLEELSFPGGKAKFIKELEEGRAKIEQLSINSAAPAREYEPAEERVKLAAEMPAAAIFLTYRDLERHLLEIKGELDIQSVRPNNIMRELFNRGYVDLLQVELFESLRKARNAIAHSGASPSGMEASEFINQASYLNFILDHAVSSPPSPRKDIGK